MTRPTLRSGLCYRQSVRLSVCLSVTLVHPTQAVEHFGNISSPLSSLAILWTPYKILRRSSHGNPSAGGVKCKRGSTPFLHLATPFIFSRRVKLGTSNLVGRLTIGGMAQLQETENWGAEGYEGGGVWRGVLRRGCALLRKCLKICRISPIKRCILVVICSLVCLLVCSILLYIVAVLQ